MQKAVGWCLREIHNVYPELAYAFIQENIKNISSVAFTIAIEKMSKKQKDELKGLRR